MVHGRIVAATLLIAVNLSCAASSSTAAKPPAATPTPGRTAPEIGTVPPPTVPSGTGAAPRAGGEPPASAPGVNAPPGGFRRRPPMTPEQRAARRDSLNAARTQVLHELMTKIAGSENKRADDEFTNIKLMKDTTAAQLLNTMDYYGKSLSVSCTYCHAVGGKWDEDTKEEKNTTRVMIELVNSINAGGLAKLRPNRNGQTPKISCLTCHRGYTTPPGSALVP